MNMALLTFARPWWLLAWLPLILLAWRRWPAAGASTPWSKLVDAHLLPHLLQDARPRSRRIVTLTTLLGLLLAVFALAGPTLEREKPPGYQRNAMRVLVVDLSPAMAAELPRMRAKLSALLRALPEGETALLVYADEPYLVVPPTTDVQTIARFVAELTNEAMPVPGNQPAPALAMANAILARSPAATRDIIWITTGAQGVPLAANEFDHLRLWIWQAGADTALRAGGPPNGGELVRMSEDDSDLRQIVAGVAERGSWLAANRQAARHGADLGYWLLPLLLLVALLPVRRGLLMLIGPLLCSALLAPPPAQAGDLAGLAAQVRYLFDARWQAVMHYRAGRYEEAERALSGLRDPESLYNLGNAQAKQEKLGQALAAYEASLSLRPDDADTVYNRDLMLRLLNQQNSGQSGGKGGSRSPSQGDAARVQEQWLRGVPDEPATLLRRKLALEHQRRHAGATVLP